MIRYTLNGKKPKETSKIYRKPLKIKKTTVIKAQVFQGRRKISAVKKIKICMKNKNTALLPKKITWTVTQHRDMSGSQAMFYTLKSPEGMLIVIDGGWAYNASYVRKVIKENGGIVNVWFLTHPHPDHIGAFNEIYTDPQGIIIRKIYDVPLDLKYYDSVDREWDDINIYKKYLQITQGDPRVCHLYIGDSLQFEKIRVDVLHSYSPEFQTMTNDICNDTGLVLKFTGQKNTILFMADNGGRKIGEYLLKRWGTRLQAEYVQTGHHGNNSLPEQLYEYIKPKIALFDAPQWLLEGAQYTTKKWKNFFLDRGVTVYAYPTAPNSFEII